LTIDQIEVGAWTWEVTGKSYDKAGTVTYTHRFWMDGESYQEPGIFHFVKHKGEWAWFFGETKRFVDRQIARFGDPESASASPFRNEFDADVDRYWARIFAGADRDYLPPKAIVGFDAEVGTGCGPADPLMSPAFYCPFDESIYYVIDFRREITGDMGDYAWVSVVAHEWGSSYPGQPRAAWVGAIGQDRRLDLQRIRVASRLSGRRLLPRRSGSRLDLRCRSRRRDRPLRVRRRPARHTGR
jgi:hypothetical protein